MGSFWTSRTGVLVAAGVVGLVVLSFVLPGVLGSNKAASEAAHATGAGARLQRVRCGLYALAS